jgi:hypothetical protein
MAGEASNKRKRRDAPNTNSAVIGAGKHPIWESKKVVTKMREKYYVMTMRTETLANFGLTSQICGPL